jgi:lipoprotein-anchoring transpeptidase ErfK/SrfK
VFGNRSGKKRRALAWTAVVVVPAMAMLGAVGWWVSTPGTTAGSATRSAAPGRSPGTAAVRRPSPPPAVSPSPAVSPTPAVSPSAGRGGRPGVVLTSGARKACPAAAHACVDLTDHVTWLQSRGQITFGPVRMKPGGPKDPTPRGVFHVAWKAGAHYISTSYDVPIPYAVFFAAGGIAFHAGSLTKSSHGCVHLTLHNARYYHSHLPIGAEVAVFRHSTSGFASS